MAYVFDWVCGLLLNKICLLQIVQNAEWNFRESPGKATEDAKTMADVFSIIVSTASHLKKQISV